MRADAEFLVGIEDVHRKYRRYFVIKRGLDIIITVFSLLVLAPIFLFIAVAIKLDSKGKIIFAQYRCGKDGKPFLLYKFRSMETGAENKREQLINQNEMDGPVFKMLKDPRITRVGRFIRQYSLDELPQLYNVLRGEMSIVGPRPLVVYEADQLQESEKQRHIIKPGLTCYWQISGRNDLSFKEWIQLDFRYIREMSIRTDLIIIIKTFKAVVSKKGAR